MSDFMKLERLVWQKNEKKILDIDNLCIGEHERIALMGSNGAGKTSLVRMLALLGKPDEGRITYPGLAGKDGLAIRRELAVVFQEANLLKGTVLSNVALGLAIRGVGKKEREEAAMGWLEEFGIAHLARRRVRGLSGGEAKRVSLARAFATNPRMIFMDEPFSALDVPTRSTIIRDLSRIVKQNRTTLLFITHHPAEVPILADRVLVMEEGRIVEDGSPEELFRRPKSLVSARLMGYENIWEAVCEDGEMRIGDIKLIVEDSSCIPQGELVNILVKAEDVVLHEPRKGKTNVFGFRVAEITPMHDAYLLSDESHPPTCMIMNRADYLSLHPETGSSFEVHIPPQSLIVIRNR